MKLSEVLATAIVLLGIALRSLGLHKEPWFDEMQTVLYSQLSLPILQSLDWPPLHFALYGLFGAANDVHRCRLISLVLSALFLIFLCHVFLKRYPQGAAVGMLYVASAPFLIRYAVEARGYGLLVLLTAFASGAFVSLEQSGRKKVFALALVVCVTLASLTHAVGVFLGPVFAVGLLISDRRNRFYQALCSALIIMPTLATLGWMHFTGMKEKLGHVDWIAPPSVYQTARASLRLAVGFTDGSVSLFRGEPELLQILSLIALICAVGILVIRSQGGRIFLLLGATYFLAVLTFSLLLKPILLTRTLLPLTVFLGFFFAASFQTLKVDRLRTLVFGLMVIFSFCSSFRWAHRYAEEPLERYEQAVEQARSSMGATPEVLLTLGRCRLIRDYHFQDWEFRTKTLLRNEESFPEESSILFVAGHSLPTQPELAKLDRKMVGRRRTTLHSSEDLILILFGPKTE